MFLAQMRLTPIVGRGLCALQLWVCKVFGTMSHIMVNCRICLARFSPDKCAFGI